MKHLSSFYATNPCPGSPPGGFLQFRGFPLQVSQRLGRLPPPAADPRPAERPPRCPQFSSVFLFKLFFFVHISVASP